MCSFAGRMRVSLPAGSHWTTSISKLVSGGSRNLSGDSHSRRTLQFQCAKFPPPLLQIALSGPCYVSILAQHNDQGHFYHCIILSSDVAAWSMVVISRSAPPHDQVCSRLCHSLFRCRWVAVAMSRSQLHLLLIRSVHACIITFSDVAGFSVRWVAVGMSRYQLHLLI